jgi:hypothetical protein
MPLAADLPHRGGGGGRNGPGPLALVSYVLRRDHCRRALAGGAVLASALLLVTTPRLRHSPALHLFADMRNLLGVPNTLNVLTSYPLLLAGVPGLVLCLGGSGCFGVRCVAPLFAYTLFNEMSH